MENKYCLYCGKEIVNIENKSRKRKYCSLRCGKKAWWRTEKGKACKKRYRLSHPRVRKERIRIDITKEVIGIESKDRREFRKQNPQEFVKLPYGLGCENGEIIDDLETPSLLYCNGLSSQIQKEIPQIIENISKRIINEELSEEDIKVINERKKKHIQKLEDRKNCLLTYQLNYRDIKNNNI